jgi:hypothetical protein
MVKIELIAIECPEGKKIVKTEMESGLLLTYENLTQEEILNERLSNIEKQLSELQERVDGMGECLSPAEKFLIDAIEGVKPSEPDVDGCVVWFKDGEWLFVQDFKFNTLWVRNKKIWSVLEYKYGLNYNEIKQLINNVMYEHTNNGQLTSARNRTEERY